MNMLKEESVALQVLATDGLKAAMPFGGKVHTGYSTAHQDHKILVINQ